MSYHFQDHYRKARLVRNDEKKKLDDGLGIDS